MLLSLLALGAYNTARLLGDDAVAHADASAVHSADLAMLQNLTAFPSCVASCATGAFLCFGLLKLALLLCKAAR